MVHQCFVAVCRISVRGSESIERSNDIHMVRAEYSALDVMPSLEFLQCFAVISLHIINPINGNDHLCHGGVYYYSVSVVLHLLL